MNALQKNSHLLVVPVLVHKKFKKTLFKLYFDIFLKVKSKIDSVFLKSGQLGIDA